MLSQWYQALFPTRLAADKQAVNDFMTTEMGFRMATSVGGVLTGRGSDFIIIDDPLKPDDAFSETRRNAVNNWYDGTLLSRLNDKSKGCIIIIMQRLHQDDLVGHVLGQEDWEVVSFPAIAENDEEYLIESLLGSRVFRRKAGDVLHEERETRAMLAITRQNIGEFIYSSQYQQNPVPVGGAIVKADWIQYYDGEPPSSSYPFILQSWDTANKSTELSDYSVCTTWLVVGDHYYLLDVFRQRLNYPDLKRAVMKLNDKYNPKVIVIEDKASGTSLIQDLRASGLSKVKEYAPLSGMDKVMRLHAQTALIENGHALFPRQAVWLADYIHELTTFPGTKHDDQVDSTTQALDYLNSEMGALFRRLEIWAKLGE
jgi:predicted phage terminase large subunit-like protein